MIQELKNLATVITKKQGIKSIKIQFKNTLKGRARLRTRSITIPTWVFKYAKEYQYYYMIHELTHFIERDKLGYSGHDNHFKKIESRILKEYGIIPIYSKAYAKELRNLKGEILYSRQIEREKIK